MKKWYLIGGGVLLLIVLLIAMLNGGGDAEEGEEQIAADSSATVTALPSNTSGNVASMTKTKPRSQPQTQQEEQQIQQEFQEQQVQTGHAKEDLSLEWQSGDGSISFVTQDGINWSETEGGVVKFKFKTTDVTAEYVEIYDAKRQMTLRIIDNSVYFYDEEQDQWNLLVNGGWVE